MRAPSFWKHATTSSPLVVTQMASNFVDLFGTPRSKMVPASAVEDIAADGAGFAGFAAWLDMTPANADVLVLPDPDSLTVLPWNKEVAWLACNPMMNGAEVDQAPRNVLRAQNRALAAQGLHLVTGVETEWHLLHPTQGGPLHSLPVPSRL